MQLNNYGLEVILGDNGQNYPRPPQEDEHGYVNIQHNTIYKLRMRNTHATRCDAEVTIDGTLIGTWRIEAWRTIVIERPVAVEQLFVALLKNSAEGDDAALGDVSRHELGLIQVVFKPEVPIRQPSGPTLYTVQSSAADRTPEVGGFTQAVSYDTQTISVTTEYKDKGPVAASRTLAAAAVGTGLIGHSDQQFVNVEELNYDYGNETIITLRLIDHYDYQAVNPVRQVKPLRQTPVPPPVG